MSIAEITDDVGTITTEVARIYHTFGCLTASLLVSESTPEDSPLHDRFEWDDTVAGPLYREAQARSLIRQVKVTFYDEPVRKVTVRQWAFLSTESSYKPVAEIAANPNWRNEMLADFKRDAARFAAKWANNKWVAEHYRNWVASQT